MTKTPPRPRETILIIGDDKISLWPAPGSGFTQFNPGERVHVREIIPKEPSVNDGPMWKEFDKINNTTASFSCWTTNDIWEAAWKKALERTK